LPLLSFACCVLRLKQKKQNKQSGAKEWGKKLSSATEGETPAQKSNDNKQKTKGRGSAIK